jgi:hypothetical protein
VLELELVQQAVMQQQVAQQPLDLGRKGLDMDTKALDSSNKLLQQSTTNPYAHHRTRGTNYHHAKHEYHAHGNDAFHHAHATPRLEQIEKHLR